MRGRAIVLAIAYGCEIGQQPPENAPHRRRAMIFLLLDLWDYYAEYTKTAVCHDSGFKML